MSSRATPTRVFHEPTRAEPNRIGARQTAAVALSKSRSTVGARRNARPPDHTVVRRRRRTIPASASSCVRLSSQFSSPARRRNACSSICSSPVAWFFRPNLRIYFFFFYDRGVHTRTKVRVSRNRALIPLVHDTVADKVRKYSLRCLQSKCVQLRRSCTNRLNSACRR